MKKFFITVALIVTTITGLFAERKWNVEYHIRTVTLDEFYTFIRLNPYWQEYEWWIYEDHDDDSVQYMDPYWDNDVVKTAMQKISQEEESIKKDKYDEKYVFVVISYEDSGVGNLDTFRTFIMNLDTYEMWEFSYSEAALSFQKRHSVKSSEKE